MDKFERLVERITQRSGLSLAEVKRKIEAKRAKLSGLISEEGAAQVVAAELGIDFDKQKVKIAELLGGMRKAGVEGKILQLYPIRQYKTAKNESKVASFLLADDTASTRVVLWDTNHIKLIEEGKIKLGSVVEIKNASVRGNELHLGSLSELKLSKSVIENVVEEEILPTKKISELNVNERMKIRASVVQTFEPRFFPVCPECGIKIDKQGEKFFCVKHGNVIPNHRFLFSLTLDDGSANIRAVCFGDIASKILQCEGQSEKLKNPDFFLEKKENLLGKEYFFSGRCRQNKLFERKEFIVSAISKVNPEKLIEEMQKQ